MEAWSPTELRTNEADKNNNKDNEQLTHSPIEKWMKRVKLCKKNVFHFLYMKIMWDNMEFLQFGVYHKEGQAI
eukprot:4320509-Ditylum_brightwellii.AAC.1